VELGNHSEIDFWEFAPAALLSGWPPGDENYSEFFCGAIPADGGYHASYNSKRRYYFMRTA
jgi:hypothetical protein